MNLVANNNLFAQLEFKTFERVNLKQTCLFNQNLKSD